MEPLDVNITDEELISFIDEWVKFLEHEKYEEAYQFTDQNPEMSWTPELLKQVIKNYGDPEADNKVTLKGEIIDVAQRKMVDRWKTREDGCFGEIWYDLNINGEVSDLTATFELFEAKGGIVIKLNDIHVM